MQVGSLVICECKQWKLPKYGEVVPVHNEIYTIRSLEQHGKYIGLLLEEIVNRPNLYDGTIRELMFSSQSFREVQPPMKISINDLLSKTNH